MKIVCYGPWRGTSLLWQPSPGAWALTVACHAVFELTPGQSPIVAKPLPLDPVTDDDERALVEPWGPPAPRKRQPEVVVVGHAYAPPGAKVTSLVVRLGVGDLEKLLNVHGDSYFTQEGALTGPIPFTKMPLRWDRAAGPPHESNPTGVAMGKEALADAQGRVFLPNLRPMGTTITGRDEVVVPVGFGPLRATWPSRIERLHRYAAFWDPERWTEQPLPADFDISYFNVAPPNQVLDVIAGNERIVLAHLHPRFPRLVTYLAAATPHVVASLSGVEQNVPVVCDTLVFDSDRGLAFLVWRGQVPLPHPQQEGIVFVSAAPLGASFEGTLDGAPAPGAAVLPFQRAGARVETLAGTSVPSKPALPFHPASEGAASKKENAPSARVGSYAKRAGDVDTLPGTSHPSRPALPFFRTAEEEPTDEVSGDAEIIEEIDDEETDPPTLPPPPPPLIAAPAPLVEVVDPPPTTPEVEPVVEALPKAPPPPPLRLPSPEPTVALTIERCAAVAARLGSPEADGAAILEAEGLTPERWEKEHVRWLGEIIDELDRGKKKLLVAYDSAYVAAIVELRGPITAGEYARLSLAADRGKAEPVLAELGLPGDSMTRLRRIWLARMAKDPQAAAEVRAALQGGRR